MSSSAVKGKFLQIAFGLIVLVLGGGLEELLPKCSGVGFPVLLAAVQSLAISFGSAPFVFVFAVLAGAMEDALSSLTPMTSVSYFLVSAFLVRRLELPRGAILLTYPCYQLWLSVWTSGLGGTLFVRLLLAVPLGLVTSALVGAALDGVQRGGALDEQD